MKIDSEKLRAAFATIDNVPPGALESSLFVRMKTDPNGYNLTLTGALHAEVGVESPGLENATIYVDRKLLRNVLNNSAGEISIKTGDSVIFQSGRCRVEAPQRQIHGGYGNRPKGDGITTTLHERTLAHFKMMAQFTPKPPSDPHLAGILIEPAGVYATDGFNIVAVREKTGLKAQFRLPVELAQVANALKIHAIKTVSGTTILEMPEGIICRTMNADLERYPDETVRSNVETATELKSVLRIPCPEFCTALAALHSFGAGDAKVALTIAKGEMKCQLRLQGPTVVEYTLKVNAANANFRTSFYLNPMRLWAEYVNADTSGEGELDLSRMAEFGTLCVRAESGASQHVILSVEDQDGAEVPPENTEEKPEKKSKKESVPEPQKKAVVKKSAKKSK